MRREFWYLISAGVFDIEYSALQMLEEDDHRFAGMGVTVWYAGLNPDVADVIRPSSLAEQLGQARIFANTRAAIREFQTTSGHQA